MTSTTGTTMQIGMITEIGTIIWIGIITLIATKDSPSALPLLLDLTLLKQIPIALDPQDVVDNMRLRTMRITDPTIPIPPEAVLVVVIEDAVDQEWPRNATFSRRTARRLPS
jgi:hypothetical protein